MAERTHFGLDDLVQFTIKDIEVGDSDAVLMGLFDRFEGVRVGRAWLYRANDASMEGEVISLDPTSSTARMVVSRIGLPNELRPGVSLPYFHGYYEPRTVDIVLDPTREWVRVRFEPTDSIRVVRDSPDGRLFGEVEVGTPIPPGFSLLERVAKGWSKESCEICQATIGPEGQPSGYRDARDAVAGLNSSGPWFCERDYSKFVSRHDLGFLVK